MTKQQSEGEEKAAAEAIGRATKALYGEAAAHRL